MIVQEVRMRRGFAILDVFTGRWFEGNALAVTWEAIDA
jgi:hypothetical protein